jgi:hypothetical protein
MAEVVGPAGGERRRVPTPPGFARLNRREPGSPGHVGCVLGLGSFLSLLGGAIFSIFFISPEGKGDAWVSLVVGGAFGGVGLVLLYAGIKGFRGLKIPPMAVFLEEGAPLRPGSAARLRIVQIGPVTFDSLLVRLQCQRVYRRKVREHDSSTVEDHEVLLEQELVALRDQRVPSGALLEREAVMDIPRDAPPTGPAQPDGKVRWLLEVIGDAGVVRSVYHSFEIGVRSD